MNGNSVKITFLPLKPTPVYQLGARLGTFRGFGIERARLGTFNQNFEIFTQNEHLPAQRFF